MAYQANRRNGAKNPEEQRNIDNNTKNVRNAADAAIASKNPYAMAAGGAVKAADKVTGGRASEAIGKGINTINKKVPIVGKKIQNVSNQASESGMSDKVGQAASIKNRATNPQNTPNQMKGKNNSENTNENLGGGQNSSPPSARGEVPKQETERPPSKRSLFPKRGSTSDSDSSNKENDSSINGKFKMTANMKMMIAIGLSLGIVMMFALLILSSTVFQHSEYEDGLGVGASTGRDIDDLDFSTATPEQQAFYERVNDVELDMLAQGKNIDAIAIAAVYNTLVKNGAKIDYDDMDEGKIREIAEAMLNNGSYDEDTFKNNLLNNIFPRYIPGKPKDDYESMVEEVIEYLNDYNDVIEKEETDFTSGTSYSGQAVNWKQAGAPWSSVKMGNSGQNIGQIGCLVTSVAILISKSGVKTVIPDFNPGTFVQFLNQNGGFDGTGNLQYAPISKAAPGFRFVNQINLKGMSKTQKLNTIRNYANQGYYMAVEVSNGGQHWVAIDSVGSDSIKIMDPGSNITSLWNSKYPVHATKTLNLFKVG